MHVIPRYDDDPLRLPWIPAPGDTDEIAAAAQDLRGSPHERRPSALEHDGPLAVLTLDRPPLNLFDRALIDALGGRDRPRSPPTRRAGC